jgi:hypothetical protein
MKITSNKFKRTMSVLAFNVFVAFSPTQANCLSLGEINSSQLVSIGIRKDLKESYAL